MGMCLYSQGNSLEKHLAGDKLSVEWLLSSRYFNRLWQNWRKAVEDYSDIGHKNVVATIPLCQFSL